VFDGGGHQLSNERFPHRREDPPSAVVRR
jgi:hypothetical protein